jgi:DDE superfamily endonuclease
MYRLLQLYKEEFNPQQPLVCMDEKTKQLLKDSRKTILAKCGKVERYDYEYSRQGTCNIFIAIAPKAAKRVVKVTDRRTKQDFALFIEELVDRHFPKAQCIQLVLDNLNTHFESSLLETFGPRKAERLLKKLKFIYTPKHASWLNMAEIEISIMDRQCTGGRVQSKEQLEADLKVWSEQRNKNKSTIEWKFTRQDADKKLSKHYAS